MQLVIVFSSLLAAAAAQQYGNVQQPMQQYPQQQQQWQRGDFYRRGPAFLQNVSTPAYNEFNQIFLNRNLNKAQLASAVGNWSTTYNVADQVAAFESQRKQQMQEMRQNTTMTVQQLPATLNQIYSIMDDQSLTPTQEMQQLRQFMQTLAPALDMLARTALQGDRRRGTWEEELIVIGF